MWWVILALALAPSLPFVAAFLSFAQLLNRKTTEAALLLTSATRARYQVLWGESDLTAPYYPKRSYVLPVALNCLTSFVVAVAFAEAIGLVQRAAAPGSAAFPHLPVASMAGFLGAYLWVFYDIVERLDRIDVSPKTFYVAWVRLLVGLTVGYYFTLPLDANYRMIVAFGLGAFPLESIRNALEAVTRSRLNLAEQPADAEKPTLQFIQGMRPVPVQRLQEEGIRSAQDLASVNPLKLFLKTNIEFVSILEMVDQALLFTYVGERIVDLRPAGFRGAIEVSDIADLMASDDPEEKKQGEELLEVFASTLKQPVVAARNLAENISLDPRIAVLLDLWLDAYREFRETRGPKPLSSAHA